ncbi:MAG: RagB/SusD family nutrient uptake outer membrane protein [Bacteroidetes bacterium]|nr:RagB/SusD family nutrient uptake outer membrane protein [Bacteroidota bacterium]
MKRTFNKLLIGSIATLFLVSSCSKKFITKTPADQLPIDQALTDVNLMQTALYGAYSEMRALGVFGRDLPVIGDLQADNTYLEVKNSGRYLPQYNYSVTVNDATVLEVWQQNYAAILRANQIVDAKVTGADADAIKAQALGLRAICYFNLVKYFAKPYTDDPNAPGVPIVLHYDPKGQPSRNKVSEVYTQIVADLKAAMPIAPAYKSSVILSKYAIEGLLARAYLYMGDNANALTSATDVINNSGFTLVTPAGFDGFWANGASRTDKVETLFEIDADVLNNNQFDDLGAIYANGYQDIYASSQLYNLYSATDVRKDLLIPDVNKSNVAAILVNKYPNATNPDRDNLKVIRLSEVYLIAAEAATASNETTARQYLNALVAQRDASAVPYASTGAQLKTDIVTERRKELAFEGDRFFDLNRLKLPIARVANAGSIPAGAGNVNLNIPYPDNRRLAPIPQSEIRSNPTLATQQNPGY